MQSPASCYSNNPADWPAPARPYFMVVFDVSGSMIQCTNPATTFPNQCPGGATPNSCGLVPSRINDGKCALRKMVKAFSEVDFGLTTFTQTIQNCGTTSPYACTPYAVDGAMPELANGCQVTAACLAGTGAGAHGGTVRVPLPVTGTTINNMIKWADDDCENGNELLPAGPTPINGALRDAAAHLRTNAGSLTPSCRPINVILITDGGETCDGTTTENRARDAAADLYNNGLNDGSGRHVKVYPIGFGGVTAAEQTALNDIAKMGQCGALTGACATATTALTASNEADLSQKLSAIISGSIQPEECDNIDNNCNGCVDEGYLHFCDTGQTCCVWANGTQRQACITSYKNSIQTNPPNGNLALLPCTTAAQANDCAYWSCYNPGDLCDNVDNNCTQGVDEGSTKCGTPPHCPVAETCNGEDDNCDGYIDNAAGSSVPYSIPGCLKCNKTAEICDGCDNDCDGIADNNVAPLTCGLPSPPNCVGTRACKPPGAVLTPGGCLSGGPGDFWSTCVTSPANEICDGLDNNCNGTIDEGIPPTPCEIPGQPGLKYQDDGFATSQCKKGQQPCNGQCAGWIGPSQEVCDGIDNDCDGLVDTQDSDMIGGGIPCGTSTGTCSKGITACVNGVLICQGGSQPQPEVCDGFDNDCNGFVDDGVLQDAPSAADKPCWNLPGSGCSPVCSYLSAQWCPPPGGTCHDLGSLVSPPCALGSLACQAGVWKCLGGLAPDVEICDGVDNNCDGTADNGLVTTVCGTDVGECTTGTQSCTNGVITCDGAVGPTTEICDGKDNDCDGTIDNGISIGTPCAPVYDTNLYPGPRDKGQCKPGITECDNNGQQICTGGVGPSPEICDGIDNDCDGQVDEAGQAPDGINGTEQPGHPENKIGEKCGKEEGACEPGTWACSSGQFICSGSIDAQPEVCNCIDDDCDGQIDEDPAPNSGDPALCGTGKECVSYKDGCQCAAKCGGGEYPCGTSGTCQPVNKSGTEPPVSAGNRCVTEPCSDCSKETVVSGGKVECAPEGTVLDGGAKPPVCVCKGQANCHNPCYGVSCTTPLVCTDYGTNAGKCVSDNCWNIPCQTGQACHLGSCKENPCKPNSCKDDEQCKPNFDTNKPECRASCAGIQCNTGEVCEAGKCKASGCTPPCTGDKVCAPMAAEAGTEAGAYQCIDSKCKKDDAGADPCNGQGFCDPITGSCGDDPCTGVICPTNQSCLKGECVAKINEAGPDTDTGTGGAAGSGGGSTGGTGQGGGALADSGTSQDKGKYGLATGGGGCACKVSSNSRGATTGVAIAVLGLGLLLSRRRKRQTRASSVEVAATNAKRGGQR
ncbi:MAG: VWA domain-containing protein [Deltaproteobacteria bacterium]|nr:VWA domain-containing protein [Deltaproteobacteria bacterium]